jgi:hypothetical protein
VRSLGENDGTPPRWRLRALLPALLCALAGGSLTFCQCPVPVADPPRTALRPRYVLVSVVGQPLPVVITESGATRVRLLADTLLFAIGADSTRGTYTETVVLGVRDASGVETVSRTVSPTREWTRPAATGPLALPAFDGGRTAPTSVMATPFEDTARGGGPWGLSVETAGNRVYLFDAR